MGDDETTFVTDVVPAPEPVETALFSHERTTPDEWNVRTAHATTVALPLCAITARSHVVTEPGSVKDRVRASYDSGVARRDAPAHAKRPSVLIGTGGTIAWDDRERHMLGAAELASLAGLEADGVDLGAVPSYELDVPAMAAIARRITELARDGATAIVVTTGTDTLEELAWTCQLLGTPHLLGTAAVVVTGAMRFLDHPQSDGLGNLRAAMALATADGAREFGVRVAFGSEVFDPRGLRKRDARALQPFDGAAPTAHPRVPPVRGFDVDTGVVLRKVGPIPTDGVPDELTGLVLEGLGAAHLPSRVFPVVDRLQARSIPVVLASRSRSWFRRDAEEKWILEAGDLTAEQAAIALMVGLRETQGWPALRDWWRNLEVCA
jgi:L-asparaginase/Glu-tRNA(Gln) amidotransferase subunit D